LKFPFSTSDFSTYLAVTKQSLLRGISIGLHVKLCLITLSLLQNKKTKNDDAPSCTFNELL